jgi:hypothetical protein
VAEWLCSGLQSRLCRFDSDPSLHSVIRRSLAPLVMLSLVTAIAALLLVLMNLSWFDEPLLPELEALRKASPAPLDDNAYPFALGFLAAQPRDPRAAGVEIINTLQARRDRGEPATIGKEKKQAILGAPLANAGLAIGSGKTETRPSGLTSSFGLICQPRHTLDCAHRLIAITASLDPNEAQLALLFARYETLLKQAHYVETPAPDSMTPWPPLGPIAELGRMRLAISFRTDPTAVFLEKASQELAFWRMTLREAQLLGTKMSALAAIRWANDFLSTLMRERQLDASDLTRLRGFVRPFTREERDIGAAFLSESRTSLLDGMPSVAGDASWLVRLLLQRNATFNQEFRETIEPMRVRSSLDAREYYDYKAYAPLPREFHWTPGMFYNLGGKLALSRSAWDAHQFPSRVHDEDGRITLLLLQAQIEDHPELDVATLVRSSSLRNPYTGEPMEYDSRARAIGFACLHTASHAPEIGDQCVVALGDKAP